ncbi:hypothetical protein BRD15_09625 [Halobacteriales archaeon SW_6_65_15]|jgi:predicted transcriptional regulator|nr:MAG: hypothetical protein BRD15_09625 [Halobacteriales archaeon SW_6_65_15]
MSKSGYTRWNCSDPLTHETRASIYEFVERSPGAYLSEICSAVDVTLTTTRYHLDVLEDESRVTRVNVRGKRRYYPGYDDEVHLIAALDDEGTASVLATLAELDEASGGQLADELDRDASTISHHLARLERVGLVERERDGRRVVNRVDPDTRERIEDVSSS